METESYVTPKTLSIKQRSADEKRYQFILNKISEFLQKDEIDPNVNRWESFYILHNEFENIKNIKVNTLNEVIEFFGKLDWAVEISKDDKHITIDIKPKQLALEGDKHKRRKKMLRCVLSHVIPTIYRIYASLAVLSILAFIVGVVMIGVLKITICLVSLWALLISFLQIGSWLLNYIYPNHNIYNIINEYSL